MQKPLPQKGPSHRPVVPRILRPQSQETITLTNIFLLQESTLFSETYGFTPNSYTFMKGSPREKACIMHFLLMIADRHEAQQQFAFLKSEKGSNLIHFRTCDLSLFRDRAYVIASALSNMAGFEVVPRSEFLGFSAKYMNMVFRLSIYCIREQSKRLLRRLSFVDFSAMVENTATDQSAKEGLSGATFFDESLNVAMSSPVIRQVSTVAAGASPGNAGLNFSPGPLVPYCSTQISFASEELDAEALLTERISDIYRELLNAEKDQAYYESVIRCLTRYNYEVMTPSSENVPRPRVPANIGDALCLLQALSKELQDIPLDAYTFLKQIGNTQSPGLRLEDQSNEAAYPEIEISQLRELYETKVQPSSVNFPLICAGAVSLLRNALSDEALHSINQKLFPCPHVDVPDHASPNCYYEKQLVGIQSSIKSLQAQITALRKDSNPGLHPSDTVMEDAFTEAILQALGDTENTSTNASNQRCIEDNRAVQDPRVVDKEQLRMSLRATARTWEVDKLSSRLHKTFSNGKQAIPVSTFVADGTEGRLSNTVYLGDE